MTLKTALVVEPNSSRNRTESQPITLSTGPCCVSSQKTQTYFFLTNYSWYIAYVVLFRVETWSVRFRRFIFQLCQSTLAAHSAWKVISPRIFGLISGSESLDFRLLPLPIFAHFLCFPLLRLHLPRRTRESWLFLRHLCNSR